MSSNLANTAALAADTSFRGIVQAAIREHAIEALADRTSGSLADMWKRHDLAQAVIHDASSYVDKFVGVVADDAQVSATADPTQVDLERVRAVIAGVWVEVAASTPNLG